MSLRNPAYAALTGAHAQLAETRGNVRRYPADVAPFLGLPDEPTAEDWSDAAALIGPGRTAALMRPPLEVPDSFKVQFDLELPQFVAPASLPAVDPEAVQLGPDDVPEMLELSLGFTRTDGMRVTVVEVRQLGFGADRGGDWGAQHT